MFLVFLLDGKAVGICRGQRLTLEWPVEVWVQLFSSGAVSGRVHLKAAKCFS